MKTATMSMGRFHGQCDQTWRTPVDVYAALDAEFHFTLDPCHAGAIWDGTAISWAGQRIYCNPPYQRGAIDQWLAKAREADVAVYLVPARTGAAWWHEYAIRADEIRFIRGRLKFGGATINAPEWSVILVYRGGTAGETE
ncbi:MAG TPA: DNA N-6-adenine-methyltransferase [Gemmatimonadales bacterium]|nr:DNA N-6-adenine-methyltransferase [Gemmatimonadales bacterium]